MIHILARNNVKWMSGGRYGFNDARRSLLKMENDYTVEFVWIMNKYNDRLEIYDLEV